MKRIFYPLTLVFILLALCSQNLHAQTYNIFGGTIPADPNDGNGGTPIIVGTKFYVTQIGDITGFRVYRGSSNAGTFVAHLWLDNGDNTGSLLTSETFTPTITNGWNDLTFTTPVTVTPGNSYVISYYSSTGSFGSYVFFFNNVGTNYGANPIWGYDMLNAPTPGNGVFISAPATTNEFPDNFGGTGAGYYIDAVFDPLFALPVTLTDFKAIVNNKNVDLIWKTQTEENNKGFDIQRSNNNTDWYSIGYINGAGNSTGVHNYSFTDKQLAPGRYFYRLNQQDFDGHSKASSVVTASLTGKGVISLFQNIPNPVKGSTVIRFDLPDEQKVRLSIVDMTGREIKVLVDNKSPQGSHLVTLDATGLSRQLYIIRLQTETETIIKKMLVQ